MNDSVESRSILELPMQNDHETSALDRDGLMKMANPDCVQQIPYQFAKTHHVIWVNQVEDVALVVHTSTLTLDVIKELNRSIPYRLNMQELSNDDFQWLIRQVYQKGVGESSQVAEGLGDEIDLDLLEQEMPETTDLLEIADDAPIIKLINAILTQATRQQASDVHLEIFETRSVVRFRIDGILRDVLEPKREYHNAMVSRLKVMSKLDIAEKRLPQDGRISLRVGGHLIDVRVSVLPCQHGERVVLRLLDKDAAFFDINHLGMRLEDQQTLENLISAPHGLILVTGPTGSGKSTTLYSSLSRINNQRLNILTIEDPVEYDMDGVGQMQVQSKIGLTFASGLRSILRQDPDVILVGEIRDYETAEITIQASLTGHLVLSTLHTNTAIGAISRLTDIGVEPYLIASSLRGILAQRLVRRLCANCKYQVDPTHGEIERFKLTSDEKVWTYRGCENCDYTGYRGRMGVYEVITINDKLTRLIHDNAAAQVLRECAREQTLPLFEKGLQLVRDGNTSLEELARVTI